MSLPEKYTGRVTGAYGVVHNIRSFIRQEIRPPDIHMLSACGMCLSPLKNYVETRTATCLECACLPTGLDDVVE